MIKRRADAVQNRSLLLKAAEGVFLEFGVNAPLDLIAERANVGRATLFRNFADRQALIFALLEQMLEQFEAAAERVAERDDGLIAMLRFFADVVWMRAPLVEYWQSNPHLPEIQSAMDRLVAMFDAPVRRAVNARLCRKDLAATDFLLLISLLNKPIYGRTAAERHVFADRGWRLMLDALKYTGAE